MMFFYDYYWLILIPVVVAMIASANVNSTYRKYQQVANSRGLTGEMAARKILDANGLFNVRIEHIAGKLSDHFDPRDNVVRLSDSTFASSSVAAVGVAAHEVGHAIQYAENYTPIRIRMAILPVAQFGSSAWILFFILGIVFNMPILRGIGIGLFAAIVLFQLITLPVEFNASHRALATIKNQGILFGAEYTGAKKTLTAAAMTYVASLAVALLQLLRLIASSRRD